MLVIATLESSALTILLTRAPSGVGPRAYMLPLLPTLSSSLRAAGRSLSFCPPFLHPCDYLPYRSRHPVRAGTLSWSLPCGHRAQYVLSTYNQPFSV